MLGAGRGSKAAPFHTHPGLKLLSKPFTHEQLATRIRDVFDEH